MDSPYIRVFVMASVFLWLGGFDSFAQEAAQEPVGQEDSAEDRAEAPPSDSVSSDSLEQAAILEANKMPSVSSDSPEQSAIPEADKTPLVSLNPSEMHDSRVTEIAVPVGPRAVERKRHQVREGDSLWSISSLYLNDPFYWPKVWGVNRALGNPDQIYPGMWISLPRPDELEPAVAVLAPAVPVLEPRVQIEEPVVEAPEPEVAPEPIMVQNPDRDLIDLLRLASQGYIRTENFEQQGVLIAAKDKRTIVGKGDLVYLDPRGMRVLEPGDHLLVFRNIRKIFHPRTDTYLGDLVVALGVIDVEAVTPKIVTGKIIKSYNYIKIGDSVSPYDMVSFPGVDEIIPENDVSLEGYVVDVWEEKVIIAEHDVVYLDLGTQDGIGRGSQFVVFRDGARVSTPLGKTYLPDRAIAKLEIITVENKTATAMVYQSDEPIRRGDRIVTTTLSSEEP